LHSISVSIAGAELCVCVVKIRQASARQNLPLVSDGQQKFALLLVLDKASQASPRAQVSLLTRTKATLKAETGVNDRKKEKL